MIQKYLTTKYFLALRLLSILGVTVVIGLFCIYVSRINFGGEIHVKASDGIATINGVSPLNSIIPFEKNDSVFVFYGYLTSIDVLTNSKIDEQKIEILLTSDEENIVANKLISHKVIVLTSKELSFLQKVIVFAKINNYKLAVWILLLGIYFAFLIFPQKFIDPIKCLFIRTKLKIINLVSIANTQKFRIILSSAISVILLLILRFIVGIKFEVLYFNNPIFIYTVVFIFFSIPITGMLIYKKIKLEKRLSFFCFWSIFFLLYFFICSSDFVGNYGFHGYFHEYIVRVQNLGLINSLLVPDTGYIALIPRLAYGLAYLIDGSSANSIAITSIFTLIIYSWIFSLLCKPRFRFLINSDILRLVFTVFLAVFSLYSLSLANHFSLSITDIAYFGVILFLIFLFKDYSKIRWGALFLLAFLVGIFIFSKAHLIVVIPLYLFAFGYCFYNYKFTNKKIIFIICILFFAIMNAVYIYFSMKGMITNHEQHLASFSIQPKPPLIVLGYTIVYYIKSYALFLFPQFGLLSGYFGFSLTLLGLTLLITCFFYAYRLFKTAENKLLALWFVAGNVIAFSSTVFFVRTYSVDSTIPLDASYLLKYISSGGVSISRYTIGIHTVLSITVIPLFFSMAKTISVKIVPRINLLYVELLTLLFFILVSSFFHSSPRLDIQFWKMAKTQKWSEEWSLLSQNLRNESFYIPVFLYPNRKQQISTDDMIVVYDSDSAQNSLDSSLLNNINTVIVVNEAEVLKNKQIKLNLILDNKDSLVIEPDYPLSIYYKFIVYTICKPLDVTAIKFVDNKKVISPPNHYRIISIKKN